MSLEQKRNNVCPLKIIDMPIDDYRAIWYNNRKKGSKTGAMISIYDGKNMTDRQLLQAVALDRAVYPQDYWLDDETALGYLHACPEIYTYAAEGDKLVAYLNMSCIDEESYLTLRSGSRNDLCIGPENLRRPVARQKNYLYFSSIVVAPDYRRKGVAQKLLSRFGEKLTMLRAHGIYFTDVIADAISSHGEKLCESWGMKREGASVSGGKLFGYSMQQGEPNAALDAWVKKLCGGKDGQSVSI